MTPMGLAAAAAAGTYLLYTSIALGWRDLRLPGVRPTADRRRRVRDWLVQAGLADLPLQELAGVIISVAAMAGLAAFAVFGGIVPAVVSGAFAGLSPVASYRVRRRARRSAAMDAWPRLLEELRILTSSLGRSVPQALFEVGRRAPEEMRPAFDAAHREWLLSTDFPRTARVLKSGLADPTADAVCETLLVAHEVGGTDLDRRLSALIDDRIQDTQGRKDARSKQAGARFARRFVLIVPAGMALAGMSVGTGREAYQTPMGQVLVVAALLLVVACWLWAGRIMDLPEERRVFDA
ncbi:MAG: type II secretion system F family protein [Acidimicrobiales bacterium]